MSALNDSRNVHSHIERRRWHTRSSLDEGGLTSGDNGFDALYEAASRPQWGDAHDTDGFSIEHQINTLRHFAERHERQIAALSADRHEHCDHLANVYQQLEMVLERLKLPSLPTRDGHASQSTHLTTSSPATTSLAGDVATTPAADTASHSNISSSLHAASPPPRQKTENMLNELLCRHRDQVYDVLADHRAQIDKCESETKRRLDAIDDSMARLHDEMKALRELVNSSEESRRSAERHLREEVRTVVRQQETHSVTLERSTSEHTEKLQQCCDDFSACLAQLSEETKAIRKQQQASEKELERQIRSIVTTEKQVAEVLERQSHSIRQLETQDSLEGAFHEVKDWLGDLEKRMVSRGELLKWTESLQQEIHTLRRVGGAVSGAISPGDVRFSSTTGGIATGFAATPRSDGF
jgi:archaellum component FlaC